MRGDAVLGNLGWRRAVARGCEHVEMDAILPPEEGDDEAAENVNGQKVEVGGRAHGRVVDEAKKRHFGLPQDKLSWTTRIHFQCRISSVGRVSVLCIALAQMVEHRPFSDEPEWASEPIVAGSIPACGIFTQQPHLYNELFLHRVPRRL